MADLKEAIKQITGKEPTPEQIQRIQAIAHSLDIPQGDAMFPILATLDVYYGTFAELPQRMKGTADEIAKNAEAAAKGRIAAASAELISKTGQQLVDAFRKDLGRTLWSRSIWAGLVLLVVGIGSYGAGELDIWWHSRQLHQIEAKQKKIKEEINILKGEPGYNAVYSCGGTPCVPIVPIPPPPGQDSDWTIKDGPYKGTPLGLLDMRTIRKIDQ